MQNTTPPEKTKVNRLAFERLRSALSGTRSPDGSTAQKVSPCAPR